jgi:hypothetical protein
MRAWITSLTRDRVLEIGLAVALGYTLFQFASGLTTIPLSALAQHVSPDLGDRDLLQASLYYLSFDVGSTVIAYGPVLGSALTLGLVAALAWVVVKRRDREFGACPFCASRIPYDSTHCAYCGSGVGPGEP